MLATGTRYLTVVGDHGAQAVLLPALTSSTGDRLGQQFQGIPPERGGGAQSALCNSVLASG